MRLLYTIILYLDTVLAAASFFFASVLLSRAYRAFRFGRPDSIYFNFGMAMFFCWLWITQWVSIYFLIPNSLVEFQAALSCVFGIWLLHYFALFTYYYPIPYRINLKKKSLFYFTSILFTVVFLSQPNIIAYRANVVFPFMYQDINPFGLLLFVAYFVFLALVSLKNLLHNYKTIGGQHSEIIKKIIIGAFFAIGTNLIFSVVLLYFTGVDTTPIGILSTVVLFAYVYMILFPDLIRLSFNWR